MKKIHFEKRWEARHPLYRLEAVMSASINFVDIIANEQGEMLISVVDSNASAFYDGSNLKKAGQTGLRFISVRQKVVAFKKEAENVSRKLIILSKTKREEIEKMTNAELNDHCQKFFDFFSRLFAYYNLSRPDYLVGVEKKIKNEISKFEARSEKQENIFVDLTTPSRNSILNVHDLEQLTFARMLLNHKNFNQKKNVKQLIEGDKILSKQLEAMMGKYAWISAQEGSKGFSRDYYISKIGEICKNKEEVIQVKINEIMERPIMIKEKKRKIARRYKIDKELIELSESVTDLSELRLKIRLWWTEASFFSLPLFQVLNNRMGLSQRRLNGFCLSEYLLKNEVAGILSNNKKISNSIIKERAHRSLLLMDRKVVRFFVGKEADRVQKKYIKEENLRETKEIKGMTANRGFVRAKAWVISPSVPNQLEKSKIMRRGDVLVVAMTRPQFIEAIEKSSAIITDEGGITCHAAIVSREFNKPCIIGTKIATRVLKDGDLVEVDADKGVVRIIKK